VKQYQNLVRTVLSTGIRKPNRTGVDTLSCFGQHYSHDMSNGFPLLTTKKMKWEHIVIENLWFLSGETNIRFLKHYGVKFWDSWAYKNGEVPSAYGHFWRKSRLGDQIYWVVQQLRTNPTSRRLVVSAWDPENAQTSRLPPCHVLFVLNAVPHIYREDGTVARYRLNLHLTQRSCDIALGVPYNLAGYSFLLHLFAQLTGMDAGIFSHTLVDAHVYTRGRDGSKAEYDHVPELKKQVNRKCRKLPRLEISPAIRTLTDIDKIIQERPPVEKLLQLFALKNYASHGPLRYRVAV